MKGNDMKKNDMKEVNQKFIDVMNNYQNKVLEWHNLMFGTFTVSHVMNYITNPNLIQQELSELGKAIEDRNAVEVLDAYLDTLWEITPVIDFLKNFIVFHVEFTETYLESRTLFESNLAIEETKEDFYFMAGAAIHNFFCKIAHRDKYSLLCSVSLIQTLLNIKHAIVVLLAESLTTESLEAATNEVINSNFSKFIISDEIPSGKVIEDSVAAYGELTLETSNGDHRLFLLKDTSGKVRKPVGVFYEPCLVKTFTTEEAANLIDLATPLIEEGAFSM